MNPRLLAGVACAALLASTGTGDWRGQRARASTPPTPITGLLQTRITIDLDETPAQAAIEHLRLAVGVPIVGRYADTRHVAGIDPDTPITLSVEDEPALTVLERILEQCGDDEPCTWQLRRRFVEVGTKTDLARHRVLRYYPVRDLLFEPPVFDNAPPLDLDAALSQSRGGSGRGGPGGGASGEGGRSGSIIGPPGEEEPRPTAADQAAELMDVIAETIEPEGWARNGGDWASMRVYQGTLIVRAPPFVHRSIDPWFLRPLSPSPRKPRRGSVTIWARPSAPPH